MSGAAFLRIKKLKGGGIIAVAARHNRRVVQAEIGASGSIDPTRSHLNETLMGAATADDVGQLAKDLMASAGISKLRKDAVRGLEIVFSLPPHHQLDDRAYFTDCVAWAAKHFACPVLSADIHRDEAQHHCHIMLLPLIDGRMDGSNLFGNKYTLLALQKDFHDKVACGYGLSKAATRLSGSAKQSASKAVLQRLRETGDKALQSILWATIRDKIESDPAAFLMAMGIELKAPAKKQKTMAQIFTGKGKGKQRESNPIGFVPPARKQTLCSVGFTPNPPPSPNEIRSVLSTSSKPQTVVRVCPELDIPSESIRVRDCDQDADRFQDGDYFAPPPPPARQHRQAVDAALSCLIDLKVRQKASFSVSANRG
jgi:hypothetical protein